MNVAAPVTPAQPARLVNVAANPLTAEQDWLGRTVTQPYPKAFASYTNTVSNGPHCHSGQTCKPTTFDAPLRATDGWIRYDKIPDDRWTNSGSPNATDHLGVDFGAPRKINEVKFYTYDDGANIRVPASYTVQYLSNGSWVNVPNQTRSPSAPAANNANEVTFPTITTSLFRVVFTPQAGKFVCVTELGSWYPETPAVKIVNKNSGMVLGVQSMSTASGAQALQWGDNGTTDHLWRIVTADGSTPFTS